MRESIIITGLTGMLNSYIYDCFKKKFNIIFFHHKKIISKKKYVYLNYFNKKKIKYHIARINPQCIFHAAGITNVDRCENNKKLAKKVNYKITKNLVDICKQKNIFFIYISTDHLFNGKNFFGYTENSKPNPLNEYAKTKILSEKYIKKNLNDYLIVRTNFFGKGNKYKSSFSDKILNTLKKNKEINLYKDVYFNPISMKILSKIVYKLYDKNIKGTFNIATDKKISKYNFGIKLAKFKKLDFRLIKKNSLKEIKITRRPKVMFLRNSKLKNIIKFKSRIEESLRDA